MENEESTELIACCLMCDVHLAVDFGCWRRDDIQRIVVNRC